MNITYSENRHLRKFFHLHEQYQSVIYQDVRERLPQLITIQSAKIKTARQLRNDGLKIYEYKIIAAKDAVFRLAYTYFNDTINVIYISQTIIKHQFCKLLEKTELVD
ncbi:hypothetical protein [Photobacterium phosphoreum]|uniref:Addiction module toxin RelE n=1 Tax=Photobacterium phosphoreum TaxID=659 RepID=A0A2T3JMY4_PHOPO|nr:hypothetical protein [Photobacterium phosphoreum]MCD9463787.1 hypothetical protein [Photobacterium phosphoreum]MCD9471577.1 hypothetical protein [Photobacterium phosphoreum]MCD9502855.1 hypothetical protein [Photobacterium phosphoreum]MCD9507264.1 hypothetical protein [Photobacterium phosphoreum]MCD9510336.1 hypothetical protein [Photobacterium phosphoreum]